VHKTGRNGFPTPSSEHRAFQSYVEGSAISLTVSVNSAYEAMAIVEGAVIERMRR